MTDQFVIKQIKMKQAAKGTNHITKDAAVTDLERLHKPSIHDIKSILRILNFKTKSV